MEKRFTLAEAIYNLCNPEMFREWEGCNDEPEYLSKHLASTDISTLAGLYLGRIPSLKEVNAMEETTFVTIGYPKCWEGDKELCFISKSYEIDLPD